MEFFKGITKQVLDCIGDLPMVHHSFNENKMWHDVGSNQVVLQRDTACELDGTGFNLITGENVEYEVIVIGDDIRSLSGKCSFARVSLIQLEAIPDEQKAYNTIRKIEYVKYHWFPDGYMMRTSSRSHKEVVRVSKKAVKKGIDFEAVGNLLIKKYSEIPAVKGARVYFITLPDADFSALSDYAQKNNRITEALNHAINSVNFDCDTCNLKAVCDEVEGMKELHFKTSMKK